MTILFSGLIVSEISLPHHTYFKDTKTQKCSMFGKRCFNSHSLSVSFLSLAKYLFSWLLVVSFGSVFWLAFVFLEFWSLYQILMFPNSELPWHVRLKISWRLTVFDLKIWRSRMIGVYKNLKSPQIVYSCRNHRGSSSNV